MLAICHETNEEMSTGIDYNWFLAEKENPEDVVTTVFGEIFPKDVSILILSFRCPQEFLSLSGEAIRFKLADSWHLVRAQERRVDHVSAGVRSARHHGQKFAQGRTPWSTPEEDQVTDLLLNEIRRKEDLDFLLRVHFPQEFRLIGSS